MLDGTVLIGFVAAAMVVLVLPGPGVLYVVARSAQQGTRAGLASAFGLSVGALVHVVAAAVGLTAVLLTSATAFNLVKSVGAAYLIYLGVKMLLSAGGTARPSAVHVAGPWRLFVDGVVVSIFNPKIAVFFLAFLPQFVDPAAGGAAAQILLLGGLYAVLAFVTDSTYALLAGRARHWLGGQLAQGPLPRYLCGGVYIGLGVNTALSGRQS